VNADIFDFIGQSPVWVTAQFRFSAV
jgi:hypothetical protein